MTKFYQCVGGVGSYKSKIQNNACFVSTYLNRNFIFREIFDCSSLTQYPDLPFCLGVLKHRVSLAMGAHLPAKKITFYDGFFLMWCYLNMLTILKFPEHVCLTACVGLPCLPPSGPKYGSS